MYSPHERPREKGQASDYWEPPIIPRWHAATMETKVEASPRKKTHRPPPLEPSTFLQPQSQPSISSSSDSKLSYESSLSSYLSSPTQSRTQDTNLVGNFKIENRSSKSLTRFLTRWQNKAHPRTPETSQFEQIRIERRVSVDQQSMYDHQGLANGVEKKQAEKRQWTAKKSGFSNTIPQKLRRDVKLSHEMKVGRKVQRWIPRP